MSAFLCFVVCFIPDVQRLLLLLHVFFVVVSCVCSNTVDVASSVSSGHREADRQDRQSVRQTDSQKARESNRTLKSELVSLRDRQTDSWKTDQKEEKERKTEWQSDGQTDRKAIRWTDGQIDSQSDRQTGRRADPVTRQNIVNTTTTRIPNKSPPCTL